MHMLSWLGKMTSIMSLLDWVSIPTPMYVLYTQCMHGIALKAPSRWQSTLTATPLAEPTMMQQADNDAHAKVHAHQLPLLHMHAIICDSLNHMITTLMPDHILCHTKRYLHCKCCKPANMKVCMFYNHLSNMVLNKLHCLPPFGNNQLLAMDEVVNILLFATPNSWQVKMEEQNWDPMDHTPTEVVDFMECLENAKAMDHKAPS
jgi:hypothetical protein